MVKIKLFESYKIIEPCFPAHLQDVHKGHRSKFCKKCGKSNDHYHVTMYRVPQDTWAWLFLLIGIVFLLGKVL